MKKALICLCLLAFLCPVALAQHLNFYSHGDRTIPKIAITVDDCYKKNIMEAFMDEAHAKGAKLTFFIVGRVLKGDDDEPLMLKLLSQGHEIGNHSNNHKDMRKWKPSKITQDITAFQTRLDKVFGFRYAPNLIRFPFGISCISPGESNYNEALKPTHYKHIVHWDVTLDTPEAMLKRIQNGSIVLFHTTPKDLKTFKAILPELLKTYELCTVSELLNIPEVKREME